MRTTPANSLYEWGTIGGQVNTNTGILSPVDCENRLRKLAKAGV